MSSFNLLSKKIKSTVYKMGWDELYDIQEKSIPIIINSNKDVVLSSPTASGKTEAAFLPILSLIEDAAIDKLKILYISPLKALINNQFDRIEELTEKMDIEITKWHGDASRSKKRELLKSPSGILQITPESLESIMMNYSGQLTKLFGNLEYVVIDEVHSFIGTDRGTQLRSLLYRTCEYSNYDVRLISLSATLDNFDYVREWINPSQKENVDVIVSNDNNNDLLFYLLHMNNNSINSLPIEMVEDLYNVTKNYNTLIFCNSRGDVEETTVLLNKLSQRENNKNQYLVHHSSVDKKEREFVEKLMSNSTDLRSVVATSSLELGIDIGAIDRVIQIDSTFTVSSLKQRLGRSGRTKDKDQILQLYSTEPYSMLQSLAVMELLLEDWVEPAKAYKYPADILFHQIISICHQNNGVNRNVIYSYFENNKIFSEIGKKEFELLIEHMLSNNFLELINGADELIVGLEGERLLRNWTFYSVFMTNPEYEVIHNNKKIGKLDRSGLYHVGENIILAGKLWKIVDINTSKSNMYVEKANDAKKPRFQSGIADLNNEIPIKMHSILCSDSLYNYLSDEGIETLNDLRYVYHKYKINDSQRLIWKNKNQVYFETYIGTKIAWTLYWMFKYLGYNSLVIKNHFGLIEFTENINLNNVINEMKMIKWEERELIKIVKSNEMFQSKYIEFLPMSLQEEMHIKQRMDISGAIEFLENIEVVEIH